MLSSRLQFRIALLLPLRDRAIKHLIVNVSICRRANGRNITTRSAGLRPAMGLALFRTAGSPTARPYRLVSFRELALFDTCPPALQSTICNPQSAIPGPRPPELALFRADALRLFNPQSAIPNPQSRAPGPLNWLCFARVPSRSSIRNLQSPIRNPRPPAP